MVTEEEGLGSSQECSSFPGVQLKFNDSYLGWDGWEQADFIGVGLV